MYGVLKSMRKIIVTDVIKATDRYRLWEKEIPSPVQEGWDWNRLPGTTTIHLPFELLDSPLKGTTMARSTENFSGSSSLGGMNGMFAMKLTERDYENFTPDFVARKSVFCFDNRTAMLTILRRPLSSRRNLTAKSRRQVRITIGCTTAMIIIIM